LAIAGAAGLALAGAERAQADDSVTLRLSNWLPAAHPMSKFLDEWVASIGKKTQGHVKIETYHSGQLGPVTAHYDMVRKDTVDIGFMLQAMNSERFPLTGLIDIPFLVKSSVQGTKVMNNPELRRKYLDPEHRGVKVLLICTNQPAQIMTTVKGVHMPADLKGQRIRFPSGVAKIFLDQMGASSVGLPPSSIAENLQKSVIDGLMMDYGGAGVAYKLGGMVKHVTELDIYSTSFALVMNPKSYQRIPAPYRKVFDDSMVGVETRVGEAWDSLNDPGKQALVDGGAEIILPTKTERDAFEAVAADVRRKVLHDRDAAGVPATQAYELMQKLAAQASA
jgi:TRAP-type C4-dicarboxylate transport system substrate-binding protein